MFDRKIILTLCGAAALGIFAAPPAHAENFLEKTFPHVFGKKEEGPDPSKTLIAPFADQNTKVTPEAMKNPNSQLTDENMPIDQPHRPDKEVGKTVMSAVADMFMIDFAEYEGQKAKMQSVATPAAIAQYDSFLRGSGILRTLEPGTLKLNDFVETNPIMLGKGVYGGVYRWLFEVPVTLTLLDRDATSYEGAHTETHAITVRVQVSRTTKGKGTDGVIIETIEVKQRQKK